MGCGATKEIVQSLVKKDRERSTATLSVLDDNESESQMEEKTLEEQQEELAVQESLQRESDITSLVERLNSAVEMRDLKRHAEALSERKAAVASSRELLGPKHKVTINALCAVGVSYCDNEEYREAEAALAEALEGQRALLGNDHIKTAETMYWLGQAYYKQGKYADAVNTAEETLRVHVRTWPSGHPQITSAERAVAKYKKALSRGESGRGLEWK